MTDERQRDKLKGLLSLTRCVAAESEYEYGDEIPKVYRKIELASVLPEVASIRAEAGCGQA